MLFLWNNSFSQEAKGLNDYNSSSIKVAYMGSVIYPGFKIGVERPSKITILEKKSKTVFKEKYWTYNLGFYHHATFHSNAFMLVERQSRRQFSEGFFLEGAIGLGYSRTFLGGTTYTVNDIGDVAIKRFAGYNYGMLSFSSGIGYDFYKKNKHPIKAYFKPSLFLLAPSNSFIYARPTVEIGVIYSSKSFWKSNPSIKNIKK